MRATEQSVDEPLFSPRRIFNAIRMWLWFVAIDECKFTLWQVVLCYRRPEANQARPGGDL